MLLAFMQSLEMRLLERRERAEAPPSRIWSTNYKWFINPILQCPYCQEWLETRRVWVVDENELKVKAVYDLGGGEELDVAGCHPHVGPGGRICMGSASTPAEALFAGLNSDAFVKPVEWLPNALGHRCGELDEAEEEEDRIYCRECEDQLQVDEAYYSESSYGVYCYDCYWERHWRCDRCDGEWCADGYEASYDVGGSIYCRECFTADYFLCEGCEETVNHRDCAGDNRCQNCYAGLWESCVDCGNAHLRADNMLDANGQCPNCRPPAELEKEEEDNE